MDESKVIESLRNMPEQEKARLAAMAMLQGIDIETQLVPTLTNVLTCLEILIKTNRNYIFLTR